MATTISDVYFIKLPEKRFVPLVYATDTTNYSRTWVTLTGRKGPVAPTLEELYDIIDARPEIYEHIWQGNTHYPVGDLKKVVKRWASESMTLEELRSQSWTPKDVYLDAEVNVEKFTEDSSKTYSVFGGTLKTTDELLRFVKNADWYRTNMTEEFDSDEFFCSTIIKFPYSNAIPRALSPNRKNCAIIAKNGYGFAIVNDAGNRYFVRKTSRGIRICSDVIRAKLFVTEEAASKFIHGSRWFPENYRNIIKVETCKKH